MRTMLLAVALLLSSALHAQVSHVQSISTDGDFSGEVFVDAVFGSNVTSGNLIVGCVAYLDDGVQGELDTITDTLGNTYVLLTPISNAPARTTIQPFYTVSEATGANTVTATFTIENERQQIAVHEVSGVDADPFDVEAGQTQDNPGTGTDAVTSGADTTTTNGQYIFGCTSDTEFTTTKAAGTGFTAAGSQSALLAEYLIQGSAGSIAATFTVSGFTRTNTVMATFKEAGGGGGGTVVNPITGRGGAAAQPIVTH